MCSAPRSSPIICLYCGNEDHRSSECDYHPWGNREKLRRIPQYQPHNHQEKTKNLANAGPSGQKLEILHKTLVFSILILKNLQIQVQIWQILIITGKIMNINKINKEIGFMDPVRVDINRLDWDLIPNHQQILIHKDQPNNQSNPQFPYRDHRYEQQRGGNIKSGLMRDTINTTLPKHFHQHLSYVVHLQVKKF